MPEYKNVEQPFLEKLGQLGWDVISQGSGFPSNPKASKRNSFREIILEDDFKHSVKKLNLTDDGREWLTDKQIEEVFRTLTLHPGQQLLEINRQLHKLLLKNATVSINELTSEHSPLVRLIDFKHPERNHFLAINQFRIDTPVSTKSCIIPDIVLFVNGMPIVVIECKDTDVTEPLSEAFIQINRYSNHRDDDYGVQEGEEKLFHCNLFSIITYGTEARFGTITGEFEHYTNWKDIFPEVFRTIQIKPNEERQEVLIHGMLNKTILLDIMKNYTIFQEEENGATVKKVCRYQQYRAVGKILEHLRSGQTAYEKGGVIWHTQGSGKSLTMVFLIKKLRDTDDLKDYKLILINDRIDLEDQLSDTVKLSEETVTIINHRPDLDKLATDSSNLNMVMMHKFLAQNGVSAQSLIESGLVPKFEPFQTINADERILILIDEAHRTQGGDMGDNLFIGFPNAVKVAFTGTPLLTDSNKQKTHERFGGFIDIYKMNDSVADRATVDILYIGRTTKDQILNKEVFQTEYEDMFRERTEDERQEIARRYGTALAYLESLDRIKNISEDIVKHYSQEILPNGFKAQVVSSSILSACRYKFEIENAIKKLISLEELKNETERDNDLLTNLNFIKVAAVVTMVDNNELGYITAARNEAKDLDAINNFKKAFNYEKPETGVAILCVCDRLLTGFDAPIEQVMYLDKNLREHDLMQAIARVNRPKVMKNGYVKEHGIVIDYFGIAQHLREALQIYTDADQEELNNLTVYLRGMDKEIPVLESRYRRMLQLYSDYGVKEIEDFVNQRIEDEKKEWDIAEDCIILGKDVKFRAQFDTYIKAFFDSLDLLFNSPIAKDYYVPAKRLGYLLIRMRDRYKDETLDLKWAGAKVRKLLDKYLASEGIDTKISPVKLLSGDFLKSVEANNKNNRAKASEMEHAIRWHIKVNIEKDPALYTKFNERLQRILDEHKENWDIIVVELEKLRDSIAAGRENDKTLVPGKIAPFFDLINMIGDVDKENIELQQKVTGLATEIYAYFSESLRIQNFWQKPSETRKLESKIQDELEFSGIPALKTAASQLTAELINLAKNREKEILSKNV